MWHDTATTKNKDEVTQLKREAHITLSAAVKIGDALLSELKAKYREVDATHTAALWTRVRELFDYPVFVASPKAVGITSTGETGEGVTNHLPELLAQFRQFQQWLAKGASALEPPNFLEPSTA